MFHVLSIIPTQKVSEHRQLGRLLVPLTVPIRYSTTILSFTDLRLWLGVHNQLIKMGTSLKYEDKIQHFQSIVRGLNHLMRKSSTVRHGVHVNQGRPILCESGFEIFGWGW